jgi:hypothetical protein
MRVPVKIEVVDARTFTNVYLASPFPTRDRAEHWIAVLDGWQGTKHSMRQDTEQARLDEYCIAAQQNDEVLWFTDAADLRAELEALVADDDWRE